MQLFNIGIQSTEEIAQTYLLVICQLKQEMKLVCFFVMTGSYSSTITSVTVE